MTTTLTTGVVQVEKKLPQTVKECVKRNIYIESYAMLRSGISTKCTFFSEYRPNFNLHVGGFPLRYRLQIKNDKDVEFRCDTLDLLKG